MSFYLSREKLLAHKTRDSGFYIDNIKSLTYYQIIKGKDYYPDGLYCYTQYT